MTLDTSITDNSFLDAGPRVGIKVDNSPLFLRIVPVPTTQAAGGQDGDISYDAEYFYIRTDHKWRRVALAEFVSVCADSAPLYGTDGSVEYNSQFFYIYTKGSWKKVAIAEFNFSASGNQGDVMYDTEYFYIYTSGQWRRVAVATFDTTPETSCQDQGPVAGYAPEGNTVLSAILI
jgi:hypothetical protein